MYSLLRNQAAAAYSSLYLFIFLSLQFSNVNIFVTLFSGTVRSRRLKLCTDVDSGQMYRVYWNQAAFAYSSLYIFIFLSLQFSSFISFHHITVRPRRLKLGTHVNNGWMYRVYRNEAADACLSLVFIFLFLQISSIKNCLSEFSSELWGLEGWNFVHEQCVDVLCIMKSGCCCLFITLVLHFSFQFSNIKNSHHIFLRNCEA